MDQRHAFGPDSLPSYKKPPVKEVVCGVFFDPINLMLPHFGLFWEKLKGDYARYEEVQPLIRRVREGTERSVLTAIPLPRLWFISSDDTSVVQVQRDCFLTNWRQSQTRTEYPRYHQIIELYYERLATFEKLLRELELGPMVPTYYEMTYINHIPKGNGWNTLADVGGLFPDLSWRKESDRFLRQLGTINHRLAFPMPDQMGHLSVSIQSAVRKDDNTELITFELTTRGKPPGDSDDDDSRMWFDQARRMIVLAFADMTSEAAQRDLWMKEQ